MRAHGSKSLYMYIYTLFPSTDPCLCSKKWSRRVCAERPWSVGSVQRSPQKPGILVLFSFAVFRSFLAAGNLLFQVLRECLSWMRSLVGLEILSFFFFGSFKTSGWENGDAYLVLWVLSPGFFRPRKNAKRLTNLPLKIKKKFDITA